MKWVLVWHFYQPYQQKRELLDKIVYESYWPLVRLLQKYPRVCVSLNINGFLTEQLVPRHESLLKAIKALVISNQIELLGSAKNHALLPMLEEKEIERQIDMGQDINLNYFGEKFYSPKTFFPSELAYSHRVYRAVQRKGFSSMLVDELSLYGVFDKVNWGLGYEINKNFKIVPVNRKWSNELRDNDDMVLENFIWLIKEQFVKGGVLVTANDAELFGHHKKNRLELLDKIFSDDQIEFISVSNYLSTMKKWQPVSLLSASWETLVEDLNKGNDKSSFPIWYSDDNEVQIMMWELAWMTIGVMENFVEPVDDVGWKWHSARDHLDRGLSSCYWWWASCMPWWNPDMIEQGIGHLVRSVRSSNASVKTKLLAEKFKSQISLLVWQWHWSGEAQKRVDEFEKKRRKGLYWVRKQAAHW